jgi:hypothetical protein
MNRNYLHTIGGIALALLPWLATPTLAGYDLGPEILVEAMGEPIDVPAFCVPSLADWNGDGLLDLVIGEGGGTFLGKVRIYLNSGTAQAPQFAAEPLFAQTADDDLWHYGSG